MTTSIRTRAAFLLLLAALGGCSTAQPIASSIATVTGRIASAILPSPRTAAPFAPPSSTLDAYKTAVAQHVMRNNSEQAFSGPLPPILPAIVVLNITVDQDGIVQDVVVQRSRDPNASAVALASLRRCGPLPKPASLLATNSRAMTFSETFLFGERYRFQLRSLQ